MANKLVRLRLTDSEYDSALDKALEQGFPSIPDYLHFLIFGSPTPPVEYQELLDRFAESVNKHPEWTRFRVRDMFNPGEWVEIPIEIRRVLGRIIYRKVVKDGWLSLIDDGKDTANAQWYRRNQ